MDPEAHNQGEISAGDATQPTRTKLRACQSFWQQFVSASLVLTWITTGYQIQWAVGPPPPFERPNAKGAREDLAFVDDAIDKLLARGSISRVSTRPRCVNPLNVVSRRGKKRLILDLRLVNDHIRLDGTRFKFEGLNDAPYVLRQDDFMFKVDL